MIATKLLFIYCSHLWVSFVNPVFDLCSFKAFEISLFKIHKCRDNKSFVYLKRYCPFITNSVDIDVLF